MVNVLVVEDEIGLAQSLHDGLQDHGYSVQTTHDGFSGYRLAKESGIDLVVLDWMLPGMSGVEVCQRLRSENIAVPILILTAKDGTTDETDALEIGADDYLRKPFAFVVLLARCDALLRRGSSADGWSELVVGDLALDPRRRLARRGRRQVDLSRREAALLEYFMRSGGKTRSKEEILRAIWGDAAKDSNLVEVYVGYLRKKLDAPFDKQLFQTVRGQGYRLEAK